MIREKFFSDPTGFEAAPNKDLFNQVWKNVMAWEERTGKSLDQPLTREDYVELLSSLQIRRAWTMTNRKSIVMYYVRYLIANGELPIEQERLLASVTLNDLEIKEDGFVYYFKNLAMLQEAINDTVSASDSYDSTLHDIPISMLYLAWYGLTEEEIINFPKSAVLDDGIMFNGKKIEMPFHVSQVLNRLKDADGYYQQARGVIFHRYVYSDYLIRTERNAKIDLVKFRTMLYRFNNITGRAYSLRYDVAHQSGIFYRAYLLESEGGTFDLTDPDFASIVFCEDLHESIKRNAKIKDYQIFKRLFS